MHCAPSVAWGNRYKAVFLLVHTVAFLALSLTVPVCQSASGGSSGQPPQVTADDVVIAIPSCLAYLALVHATRCDGSRDVALLLLVHAWLDCLSGSHARMMCCHSAMP